MAEAWGPAILREIAEQDNIRDVIAVLQDPELGDETQLCQAACRRALALEGGVEALYAAAWAAPQLKGTTAVLAALYAARRGDQPPVFSNVSHLPGLNQPIAGNTSRQASARLSDLLAEAALDGDLLFRVMQFAMQESFFVGSRGAAQDLADLLAESSVKLTRPLIGRLSELVGTNDSDEHTFQTFLARHPVFLEPLAAEVVDRHRLGDDLVTDYIIRTHDDRYTVVEIEKPQDNIFTARLDFTSEFTHAFGQVVDFLGWLDHNVAYARTKLPHIEAPSGLLVIGRRSDLSDQGSAKLRRFSDNSRRVSVVTFDDLIDRAMALYRSLRYER